MSSNKLTWQELRKAVAEYANCSEQEVDSFLNALLESVVEGLKQDKQVKIKGLGAFSLKSVSPRKSVNIATGEDFTIEGYNKLTFNAESTLKESVEKRLEPPKTETIMSELNNDPIKKLSQQADEIVDILASLGQAPDHTKEIPSIEMVDKKQVVEPTTDNIVPEEVEEPTKTVVEREKEEILVSPKIKKKCKCKWVYWTIGALILLGLLGTGAYLYREQITNWWYSIQFAEKPIDKAKYHDIVASKAGHKKTVQSREIKSLDTMIESVRETIVTWWEGMKLSLGDEEVIEPKNSSASVNIPMHSTDNQPNDLYEDLVYQSAPGIQANDDIMELIEEVSEEVIEEVSEEVIEESICGSATEDEVSLADLPRTYTTFIATEVVDKDSRLAWIAYKHYGHKDLWVFIYEANRDKIAHPARVTPGQRLRIPALDARYMDMNNPELQELLKSLSAEYLK